MKTVYLAGPITGTSYSECTDWRKELAAQFPSDVKALSPLRAKTYLRGENEVQDSYAEHIMSTQRGITTRDRWDCMCCDAVVMNLLDTKRVSIGTMIEMGWCDSRRIPIIVVMEEGNIHQHSMVLECASWVVGSLEEAAKIVRALFDLNPEHHDTTDGLLRGAA